MVVVMRPGALESETDRVIEGIRKYGMDVHVSQGKERTIIGIIGDEREVDFDALAALPGVERALPILHPYKYVSRNVHPETRVIECGGARIGEDLIFMAGPCSVEEEDTTLRIAEKVKAAGAQMFRAGAYKPRTSPWSFQGLREKGLKILSKVRKETGMAIVTEIMDCEHIPVVGEHADIFQVGMRNMKNYALLNRLGEESKPVLLKRGDSSTVDEWLAAADYIVRNGNEDVILCERGIRTFETYTRNTLDLSAIGAAKKESCLPVVADPSHGTGKRDLVGPMSRAAIAAGADGLMLEVHTHPDQAWSDGMQCITPDALKQTIEDCARIRELVSSRASSQGDPGGNADE
jgi:3-deoxy-7-phosphoheptulonate synthase